MAALKNEVEKRAAALHQQGECVQAIRVLTDAIEQRSDQGGLWMLRAIVRHSQADWSQALADAETAMALMPLPIGGQLVLGDCYLHVGKVELALTAYEHLLDRSPLPTEIYAGLYAGLRRCGRDDLAMKACRAAVEAEPDNHAAYFGMAHCMASLGYSAAFIASVLHQAVQLEPSNSAYRTSLAIQLVRDGKPAKAHEHLKRIASENLASIECLCSARKLMQLCLWADDQQRASALSQTIQNLQGKRRRRCDD